MHVGVHEARHDRAAPCLDRPGRIDTEVRADGRDPATADGDVALHLRALGIHGEHHAAPDQQVDGFGHWSTLPHVSEESWSR